MSKTIEVETVINAPLDDVWNEVSKIENHSNWMKDAVNIDFQTENKSGVGTKIKVLTKIGPIKLNDFMTFTKWEEKKSIGVDHIGIVTGKGEMEFNKIDDITSKFIWTETLKFPFYLFGPIGEIVGKPILDENYNPYLQQISIENNQYEFSGFSPSFNRLKATKQYFLDGDLRAWNDLHIKGLKKII